MDSVEPEEIKNLDIQLDILNEIINFQNFNGIRLKDYDRYISFCKKKINKYRRTLKITQGKKKFNKIDISASNCINKDFLYIEILECERYWAKGAEYNHRLTTVDQVVSEWRYTIKQNFKKAANKAEKLVEICKQRCDKNTVLESEAYFNTLKASEHMFSRDYTNALLCYQSAKKHYNTLISNKDSIAAIIYKDRINYLNMQIRYCDYNQKSTSEKKDIFFDTENNDENDNENNENNDNNNKTNNVKVNTTNENYEIRFQNTTIPIKNENIRAKYIKKDELIEKIKTETDLTKKQNYYSEVFNLLDDAVKLIKTDKSKEAESNSNLIKIYNKLISYTSNLKIFYQIEKIYYFLDDYSKEFNQGLIVDILEKDTVKLKIKPQEMIKLYDYLLQHYDQITSLERENPDESLFTILSYKKEAAFVCKVYYVGLLHLTNKSALNESYTVMQYFLEKVKECNKNLEINKIEKLANSNNNNDTEVKLLVDEINRLEKMCVFVLLKTFSRISLDREDKKVIKVDKDNKSGIKTHGWLYNNLFNDKINSINKENFSTFENYSKISFEEYSDALKKQNYNNNTHLIQFPPNFQLLTPKPISFDLTYPHLKYPDLSKKMKKEEEKKSSGGYFSKAVGYFFGGKK